MARDLFAAPASQSSPAQPQKAAPRDLFAAPGANALTLDQARSELSGLSQNALRPVPQQDQPKGFFTAVDDAMRGAADMLTFGFADEIAAGLGSATGIGGNAGDYDANLAAQRQRDAEGGPSRFVGQMAGAIAIPAGAARTVPAAIGQGALMGGAYGFGSGEGGAEERAVNAGYGAAVGGIAGGVVRGAANAIGNRAAKATIPSNEELRTAATRAFNQADAAGVVIRPEGIQRLAGDITRELAEFGYDPALQPGVATIVNRLNSVSDQNVTLKGMDVIRRVANNVAGIRDNPSQQAIANRIIGRIDDFIDTLPDDQVLVGNAERGSAALREARQLWGRARRSEAVDQAVERADLRASSTGSGGNVDNATRQNVRRMVENPRGMSAAEREAAEAVVRGTTGQNALRLVGKLSPQGNGLMAALGVGGAMTNPIFGIPSLMGLGAKALADRRTMANVARLSELTRSGGQTASDLATLARLGEIAIPGVAAAEQGARRALPSLSSIGAMLTDRVRN